MQRALRSAPASSFVYDQFQRKQFTHSKMISTILIDDERNCTDLLRVMLERYCPDIAVTGVFNDPELALAHIKAERPQLVFLDIEMPRLNGFDLLQACGTLDFKVVFTTAYDQYAVKAFKFNALDYLLKPIDKEELIHAVEKIKRASAPTSARVEAVRLLRDNPIPDRIALPVGQELVFVDVPEILYCESDGSYVSVFLQHQTKPILLSKSLREFEELLNNPTFFRAHNSYLVNLKQVQKIVRTDGGEIVMRNGKSLPVARAKKAELLGMIAKL
jgi:two-component system, LytTR family, response regulator